MLNNKEKLDLINSMNFIESDGYDAGYSDGVIYVLVEDNKQNREILHRIGLANKEIEKDCSPEEGTLDISTVAFKYSSYYDDKEKLFYDGIYGTKDIEQLIKALQYIKNKHGNLEFTIPKGYYEDKIVGIVAERGDGKLGLAIDVLIW